MTYLVSGCLLLLLWITVKLERWGRRLPMPEDNYTIPHRQAMEIAVARMEGRGAIFHGGCESCIFRNENTTHVGLAFCRGCRYFASNQSLPDKAISEYDLEKL